jgi:uncharacterized protein (DUF2147 family)
MTLKPPPLYLAALCVWLAVSIAHSDDALQTRILGNWMTSDKSGIIQIVALPDGTYEGRIVGGNQPNRRDAKNPDQALRERMLLDQILLRGLRYDGNGKWSGGTIYDPNSGHTYKCTAELVAPDALKLRGFLGFSLLGRNEFWTRYLGTNLNLPPAR